MKIHTPFTHLFTPLTVGNVRLRNRVIAAPITSYAHEPSPADKFESIAAKARGGAGLIIIGSVAVNDEEALIYYESSSLFGHEKKIFEEMVSMIHQYGAKASVELFHAGMFADCRGTGATPIGPCTMERSFTEYAGYERIEPDVVDTTHVLGMDEAMMQKVCDQYAASAREAVRMGFDMVMLHFGHGWLVDEFLSPFFNHRTDEYGGSFENRIRFPIRVVEAVRKAVGPQYPVDVRIGASERVREGVSLEDIAEFLVRIEDQIHMVHVSSGLDKLVGATSYIEAPCIHPHGLNVPYAEYIKSKLDHIPVAVVGSITTPKEAEMILEEGKADAIALGRPLVADPDWVNKARDGHPEDICTCIRCVSCYGVATGGCSQGCAVNPRYERELRLSAEEALIKRKKQEMEALYQDHSLTEPKKVVVIGGGPAGMNAAIAASDQGHHVILMEKEAALGGLLRISDTDAAKVDMYNYKEYLAAQVMKRPIEIRLNCEADPEMVQKEEPDEIIAAVGSSPRMLRIPGADRENVFDIVTAHKVRLGHRVAVIGAGPSGCELALSLLREGHEVALLEIADRIAGAANLLYRGALQEQFALQDQLTIRTRVSCDAIEEDGVVIHPLDKEDGASPEKIPADSVVYCVGLIPRRELAESFAELAYDVRMIGDCIGARRINEAVHEGYFAGHFI